MNITQIKQQLGVTAPLSFRYTKDSEGITSDEWLRAWDNETRTDVHMHTETADLIKAGAMNLEIQGKETRTSSTGKSYTFARIVAVSNDEPVVCSW